jgi:RNA polymerase sigma factor (sigma-70 family)
MQNEMISDSEQLRLFTANRSETAFADLVERHLPLVYSTALRRVNGDEFLAQDVTQEVFRDVSLKAKQLSQHPCLASWLYKATCFASAKAVRKEERQRNRASETAMRFTTDSASEEMELNPALFQKLDAAMSALAENERNAVLLRFFEGKQLREVGEELGVSGKRLGNGCSELSRNCNSSSRRTGSKPLPQ